MTAARRQGFDPVALLAALERHYVGYVLIGGLAQVLRGADVVTTGVDICPSFAKDNLDRLGRATTELEAKPANGKMAGPVEELLAAGTPVELQTSFGELKIVASPEGVPNGYVELRRAASREDLGRGVRPLVASTADLAAMAGAHAREQDRERLAMLRRIVELEARPQQIQRSRAPARQMTPRVTRGGPRLTP